MSRFCEAIERIPGLSEGHCCSGLQALAKSHRAKILCGDPGRLTGSVDLDEALKALHPEEPRWDYGIGIQVGDSEEAIWVEVHPAGNINDVRAVIQKARWLDGRLNEVDALRAISQKPYRWVASGRNTLTKTMSARRLIAQNRHLICGPDNTIRLP